MAIGWSDYFTNILADLGINLPKAITKAPFEGGIINLPAVLILVIITAILIVGVKESVAANNIIVAIKLIVIFLFIILGIRHVNSANWHPFMPYGWKGVFSGASIIFFAYIGFDAVSTAAEEVKNPQKDLSRGIIASLIICTVLYIVVSAILTGMVPYLKFKKTVTPVAFALQQVGITWGLGFCFGSSRCNLWTDFSFTCYDVWTNSCNVCNGKRWTSSKSICSCDSKFHTSLRSTLLVGIVTMIIAGFYLYCSGFRAY